MEEIANTYLQASKERDSEKLPGLSYDLYWHLSLASPKELQKICEGITEGKFIDLPIPFQALAFRLLGLEFIDDRNNLEMAASGMAMYCSEIEENKGLKKVYEYLKKSET